VWKVRHDEGVNGHGVVKYSRNSLKFTERPELGDPQEDSRQAKDNQQTLAIEDPFKE
jgi:hypothetical protein